MLPRGVKAAILAAMFALVIKEVRGTLSSLVGIITLVVFLMITGLFIWVFPNNVLDLQFADLDLLFYYAPWIFLFLIPALTMRIFAEEKRTGTMELLLTRPISELQIVLAKYLAVFFLIILALLPTLFYYFSIIELGDPPGNIDRGGTWGSYIGLLLLAGGFAAIGTFASSITNNQVVSFIVAVVFCFFTFIGFELIGSFETFGALQSTILRLGMQEHYIALSRGVLDSRDILYFIGCVALFITFSWAAIRSRKW